VAASISGQHRDQSFAEFEREIIHERQLAGIAEAKAEGRYKGRPRTIDSAAVQALLRAAGKRPADIAKE
jgi:DNA invertase Pin-like site-specific DNA recombinase